MNMMRDIVVHIATAADIGTGVNYWSAYWHYPGGKQLNRISRKIPSWINGIVEAELYAVGAAIRAVFRDGYNNIRIEAHVRNQMIIDLLERPVYANDSRGELLHSVKDSWLRWGFRLLAVSGG